MPAWRAQSPPEGQEAACRWHSHDAHKMTPYLGPGEVALVSEVWFMPTQFPPPRYMWSLTTWTREANPNPTRQDCQAYTNFSHSFRNDIVSDSSMAKMLAHMSVTGLSPPSFRPAPGDWPWLDGTALRTSSATPGNPYSRLGDRVSGSTFEPDNPQVPRLYMNRPQQMLGVFVVNVSALGSLSMPDVGTSGYSRPPRESDVRLKLRTPDPASPWTSAAVNATASLLGHSETYLNGQLVPNSCSDFGKRTGFEFEPVWGVLSEAPQPSTLQTCFGGHSGGCEVGGLGCGFVGYMAPPDMSNATIRNETRLAGLGNVCKLGTVAAAACQAGFFSMLAYHKPCQACGHRNAVVDGVDGAPLPECDMAACQANITRAIQRRAVPARQVPPPAALGVMRSADGGAFDWYACRPTPRESFLSGYPGCMPQCVTVDAAGSRGSVSAAIPALVGWSWPAVGGSMGRGFAAGRAWLMSWSGGWAPDTRVGCINARELVDEAGAAGLLRTESRGDSWTSAGDGSWPQESRAWRAAALSPLLSAAKVNISLSIPVGQLNLTPRKTFLSDLAAEAATAAGGTLAPCITARCVDCPSATDSMVWYNLTIDPATGTVRPAARPTRRVRLVVEVVFQGLGDGACVAPSRQERLENWLVDARPRRADPTSGPVSGAEPVAFTGPGSHPSWATDQPAATAVRNVFADASRVSASEAPVLLALSLANSLRYPQSHRLQGMWLVWANASDASVVTPVAVVPRCLDEGLQLTATLWSDGRACGSVVSSQALWACGAMATAALLAALVAAPPVAPACCLGPRSSRSATVIATQELRAAQSRSLVLLCSGASRSGTLASLVMLLLAVWGMGPSANGAVAALLALEVAFSATLVVVACGQGAAKGLRERRRSSRVGRVGVFASLWGGDGAGSGRWSHAPQPLASAWVAGSGGGTADPTLREAAQQLRVREFVGILLAAPGDGVSAMSAMPPLARCRALRTRLAHMREVPPLQLQALVLGEGGLDSGSKSSSGGGSFGVTLPVSAGAGSQDLPSLPSHRDPGRSGRTQESASDPVRTAPAVATAPMAASVARTSQGTHILGLEAPAAGPGVVIGPHSVPKPRRPAALPIGLPGGPAPPAPTLPPAGERDAFRPTPAAGGKRRATAGAWARARVAAQCGLDFAAVCVALWLICWACGVDEPVSRDIAERLLAGVGTSSPEATATSYALVGAWAREEAFSRVVAACGLLLVCTVVSVASRLYRWKSLL